MPGEYFHCDLRLSEDHNSQRKQGGGGGEWGGSVGTGERLLYECSSLDSGPRCWNISQRENWHRAFNWVPPWLYTVVHLQTMTKGTCLDSHV